MNVKVSGASAVKGEIQSSGNFLYPEGEYVFDVTAVTYKDRDDKDLHAFRHDFVIAEGPETKTGKSTVGMKYCWFNNIPKESHPKFSQEWLDRALNSEVALFKALGLAVENDVFPIEDAAKLSVGATVKIQANYKTKEEENVITAFKVDSLAGAQ